MPGRLDVGCHAIELLHQRHELLVHVVLCLRVHLCFISAEEAQYVPQLCRLPVELGRRYEVCCEASHYFVWPLSLYRPRSCPHWRRAPECRSVASSPQGVAGVVGSGWRPSLVLAPTFGPLRLPAGYHACAPVCPWSGTRVPASFACVPLVQAQCPVVVCHRRPGRRAVGPLHMRPQLRDAGLDVATPTAHVAARRVAGPRGVSAPVCHHEFDMYLA